MILLSMALPLLVLAELLPFQTIQKAKEAYQHQAYERSALLFAQLENNRSIVAYNVANAYYKAKRYDQAIKAYEEAKGVDEATRLYNLGNCYFQQGKWDRAIACYTDSLRLRREEDTQHNLALAKRKKDAQEKQRKKSNDPKKKKQQKEPKKKQPNAKKKGQEREQSKRKKPNDQEAQNAKRKKTPTLSPKERLTQKELKRLMKKLNEKRMPTMMYQVTPPTGVRHDQKPW